MEAAADGGRTMVDEIQRLVHAGGKRLRPAFCYWGFRAAGGADGEPIIRASAAMELLHTMALVHDDLIDDTDGTTGRPHHGPTDGRGRPRPGPVDRSASLRQFGALLVGDLAAVLADRLLLECGFDPAALGRALACTTR